MKAKLNVPVSLCKYVADNKYFTEFSAYVALQLYSDGITDYGTAMNTLSSMPKLTSKKSRDKHFKKLLSIGWVGYNPLTGNVFLRSIKQICEGYGLCTKRVVMLYPKDLATVKLFVYGSILCNKTRQQDVAIRLNSKKKPAVKYRDTALQASYTGLGKYGLSKLFSCSTTEAIRIKARLEEEGYIETKNRFQKVKELQRADFLLKSIVTDSNEKAGNKLFFRRFKTGQLWLCRQLHDEIKSKMVVRTKGLWFGRKLEVKAA